MPAVLLRTLLLMVVAVAVLGVGRIESQAGVAEPSGQRLDVSGAAPCDAEACMALAVKDAGGEAVCHSDLGDTCAIALEAGFTLAVDVVQPPAGGYIVAQTYVDYGPDLLYNPPADDDDEAAWPDCAEVLVDRGSGDETYVSHLCVTGLIPPLPVSHYAGNVVELAFNCPAEETSSVVRLLGDDPEAGIIGALLVTPDLTFVVPRVAELTVNCEDLPAPTAAEPTDTRTPLPTRTPTQTATTTPAATGTPLLPSATPSVTPTSTASPAATVTPSLSVTETATPSRTPPPTSTPTPTPTRTRIPTRTPLPTFTPTVRMLLGDTNCDDRLTAVDAAFILQYAADLLGSLPCRAGDVNGDRLTDSRDAALILQFVAGLLRAL